MAPRMQPQRGLKDLRTMTGKSGAHLPAYKAYLRIGFLELERFRHQQEALRARSRLALILARCRDIDAEKGAILATAGAAAAPSSAPASPPSQRPRQRGFHYAY
jgi:hypothetical protein